MDVVPEPTPANEGKETPGDALRAPRPQPDSSLLDKLIANYLRAVDRGEAPSRAALLEAYPELRAELEEFFDDYSRLHDLEAEARRGRSPLDGKTRVGDYEIIEEIARGGMGVVYKAMHVKLKRIVALKTVRGGRLASQEELERFRREAQTLAAIDHPRVVPIYEIGEENGAPYFVLKLFEGGSLASPRVQMASDARAAAEMVEKIARTVHAAHQKDILHRDLKPANILLDAAGEPYVSDFGLARRSEADSGLTGSRQVLGTASYVAPEQAGDRRNSTPPTPALDVYGLGAILYELLTRRPPFRGPSSLDTLRQVIEDEPKRPRSMCPHLPKDLESICLHALEKAPRKRYASAEEMADDLRRFLAGKAVAVRPVGRLERSVRWCRRHPAPTLIGALLCWIAIGATLGAWFLARAREQALASLAEARLAEAMALALSGKPGQRAEALVAVREAASTRRDLELRNAAIAALASMEIEVERQWNGAPQGTVALVLDAGLEHYARGDGEGRVSFRAIENDVEIAQLEGPKARAHPVRFSSDGRWLVVRYGAEATNNQIWAWSLARASSELKLTGRFTAADVGLSDRLAVMETSGTLRVYSLSAGNVLLEAQLGGNSQRLRFAGDGDLLASSSGDKLQIWRASTQERLAEIKHSDYILALAWHPSSEIVATTAGGMIYLWRFGASQSQPLRSFRASETRGTYLSFSPGGECLASTSWDGGVLISSLGGHLLLRDDRGRAYPEWSPDGSRLGYYQIDQLVGIWRLTRSDVFRSLYTSTLLGELALSSEHGLLAANRGSSVLLWDVVSGRELGSLPMSHVGSALLRGRERLLTTSMDGLLSWPIATATEDGSNVIRVGPPARLNPSRLRHLERASLESDGRYLAIEDQERHAVFLVDLEREGEVTREFEHFNVVWVALSKGARWLATGPLYGHDVKVWDAQSGKEVWHMPAPVDHITARTCFSPDGSRLVISADADYSILESGTWRILHRLPRTSFAEIPGPVAIAGDNRTLAVAMGRALELVDMVTGERIAALRSPEPTLIVALAFGAGGGTLGVSAGESVQLWDLRRLRANLSELGLDWSLPGGVDGAPARTGAPRLEIDLGASQRSQPPGVR